MHHCQKSLLVYQADSQHLRVVPSTVCVLDWLSSAAMHSPSSTFQANMFGDRASRGLLTLARLACCCLPQYTGLRRMKSGVHQADRLMQQQQCMCSIVQAASHPAVAATRPAGSV